MTFLIYPDPKWWADGNLQKAPLSWMCCLCVGLAHFHWPAHVHQHPFWCRVQHAEPSAFPVPHLPSGGRHHRGETHKEAHIRSQTLQTATEPWGHVARPAMALPGQEPAFHCAYEADTIPLNLLGLTWSRRKVPTWGSQIRTGTRTEEKVPLHPQKNRCGSLRSPKARQALSFVFRHRRAKMPTYCKHCVSSLSLRWQRARRGQGSPLVSDGALAYLPVTPLDAGAQWAEWARPKQQTLDLLYTIDHTHLFRSENGCLHEEQDSPTLL